MVLAPKNKSKYATTYGLDNDTTPNNPTYAIIGDLLAFLGKIEIKPVHSLAIAVDSGEGGGKTHMMFDWVDKFATAGYRLIIWNLEEHKTSNVSKNKLKQHFTGAMRGNLKWSGYLRDMEYTDI